MVSRGWGDGEMGSCFMGIEFQFCMMRTVLEADGGDGCTAT